MLTGFYTFLQATEDKNNAIAQADKTATKAKLADRLINGLSGENKRWNETITKMGVAEGEHLDLNTLCVFHILQTCLIFHSGHQLKFNAAFTRP